MLTLVDYLVFHKVSFQNVFLYSEHEKYADLGEFSGDKQGLLF